MGQIKSVNLRFVEGQEEFIVPLCDQEKLPLTQELNDKVRAAIRGSLAYIREQPFIEITAEDGSLTFSIDENGDLSIFRDNEKILSLLGIPKVNNRNPCEEYYKTFWQVRKLYLQQNSDSLPVARDAMPSVDRDDDNDYFDAIKVTPLLTAARHSILTPTDAKVTTCFEKFRDDYAPKAGDVTGVARNLFQIPLGIHEGRFEKVCNTFQGSFLRVVQGLFGLVSVKHKIEEIHTLWKESKTLFPAEQKQARKVMWTKITNLACSIACAAAWIIFGAAIFMGNAGSALAGIMLIVLFYVLFNVAAVVELTFDTIDYRKKNKIMDQLKEIVALAADDQLKAKLLIDIIQSKILLDDIEVKKIKQEINRDPSIEDKERVFAATLKHKMERRKKAFQEILSDRLLTEILEIEKVENDDAHALLERIFTKVEHSKELMKEKAYAPILCLLGNIFNFTFPYVDLLGAIFWVFVNAYYLIVVDSEMRDLFVDKVKITYHNCYAMINRCAGRAHALFARALHHERA